MPIVLIFFIPPVAVLAFVCIRKHVGDRPEA
jgi:hypothetical protein